jgi:hypothetical protein
MSHPANYIHRQLTIIHTIKAKQKTDEISFKLIEKYNTYCSYTKKLEIPKKLLESYRKSKLTRKLIK